MKVLKQIASSLAPSGNSLIYVGDGFDLHFFIKT